MLELIYLFAELIKVIKEEIDNNASEEEIAERVMAPGEVGRKLIAKAMGRKEVLEDYVANG